MNTNIQAVEQLLRRQRRWNQYAWPLIALAAGLAATLAFAWRQHPSFARIEKWGRLPEWWLGGLTATLVMAVILYFLRRRSAARAAQMMDARWGARNRLETAAVLANAPDAIARAQREETAEFLRQAGLRPRGISLSLLGGLVALLALAHLVAFASWARPLHVNQPVIADRSPSAQPKPASDAAQPKAASNAPPTAPNAAVTPTASIRWKSPEEEIKAAAVEEVPLEAVANSSSGFHDAVLEISVNGQSRPPVPIELAALKTSGPQTIQTSIFMDQLGVKPYDIVSYDLQAQPNGIRKAPAAVSPVQFVEIKPLREDVHEYPPTKNPSKCFNYITAIKSAQLRALKENFGLAHTDLPHDSFHWLDENKRLGGDQKTLAKKTDEVVAMMESNGAPEEILSLIRQAEPAMTGAAEKITASENEPALAPQGQALALITQVEQYLGKSMRTGRSLVQKVPDPFDKKALQLKRRDQTPAGELETLAREQARLANDLASSNALASPPAEASQADSGVITGTPAGREEQISQRVAALLDGSNFVAEAGAHLELGHRDAQTSLTNLETEDLPSAREPAAASARELQLAADAMKRAAEQVAKNELADTLRALSDAASGARLTPAMPTDDAARQQASNVVSQVQGAARSLAESARQQQETGSAKAAAQLNELAKALAAAEMQHLLQQLHDQPRDPAVAGNAADKLQDIADRAGLMRQDGPLSPAQLAQLVDRLQRAQVNLERVAAQKPATAKKPGGTSSGSPDGGTGAPASELGSAETAFVNDLVSVMREDLLAAVPTLPQSAELAQLRGQLREAPSLGGPSGSVVVYLRQIDPPLTAVIKSLQSKMQDQLRSFQLTDQEVAQAPPAYRAAVAEYYEKLSQDYHPAAPTDHQ